MPLAQSINIRKILTKIKNKNILTYGENNKADYQIKKIKYYSDHTVFDLKFQDKDANEKKSYYEIVYATIIRVDDDVKEKRDLEKIILCDVPTKIYPKLETSFLNLVHNSGHPDIKLEKKIDFEKLFKERFN